jgi:Zinc binding domain
MTSSCCSGTSTDTNTAVRCPACGSRGMAVDRLTVKALLTARALQQFASADYRFCQKTGCDVVYFNADGARFTTAEVRVAVWQKCPFGAPPVCYCFGESEASIRADIEATGRSSAVDRVREHIAAGRCACEVRNPRGACCLGDVTAAIRRVASAVAEEAAPREAK